MYADVLVIIAEHRQELHGTLQKWKELFKKYGLNMSFEKREVMCVEKQSSTSGCKGKIKRK